MSHAGRVEQSEPVDVVIPTIGRDSLGDLLRSIADSTADGAGPPDRIFVVDDRRGDTATLRAAGSLSRHVPPGLDVTFLRSHGRGPAAARNVGWRAGDARWVAFLDDDVRVGPLWRDQLTLDLAGGATSVGGIQGRITVPLPADRRPTDFERGTAGLATARWITADMAYRRDALSRVGGFDERFPRAFREDADLALRVLAAGYQLTVGSRQTTHPVRPSRWRVSLTQQRGNADDVLMSRLHGSDWRRRAEAPMGRLPQHAVSTAAAVAGVALLAMRRRHGASLAGAVWAASAAEFAWRRIAPGPRDAREIATMAATSALIPPAACWHWLRARSQIESIARQSGRARPGAVLVDRDGTLVHDVPYNGDPDLVRPLPGVRKALDRLRGAGIPVAVISNQSGIARGLITPTQVDAVNAAVERLLGPFDGWFVCPHSDDDGCACRKPAAGLIEQAAAQLGVPARTCVVIGDIGADVQAAAAGGAQSILVPTPQTLAAEIVAAPVVASSFGEAVDLVMAGGVPS